MGSWNKTCVLSNLAIYDGDKVVVFILEDGGDGSDSYATALFRPLLLPFNSVYNVIMVMVRRVLVLVLI